jgi:hypothetical protein
LRRRVEAIKRLLGNNAGHWKATLANSVRIGEQLSKAKLEVGYGNWLPWLEKNFRMSDQTARNYIQVHEASKTSATFKTVLNFDVSQAVAYAIARAPEGARIDIGKRLEQGAQITTADVRQAVRIYREPEPPRMTITAPPEPEQRLPPLTSTDFSSAEREHLLGLMKNFVGYLQPGAGRDLAKAARAKGMKEIAARFCEFAVEFQRAMIEQEIEEPANKPDLRVVH